MIQTFSKFYYGFEITPENQNVDFIEDAGSEITAEIDVGSYTPTKFCAALKNALQTTGTLVYDVTFNRMTRIISIESVGGSVKFLTHSGSHNGNDPFAMMGFSKISDTALATTHVGSDPAGEQYAPQFYLQSYVPSDDIQGAIDASIARTASGAVEVVKFGTEKFMECNIWLASDYVGKVTSEWRQNPTGVSDLRRFLQFLTTKSPIEFMPDENDPSTFETMILESTSESSSGVKYRLKELYDKGFLGYYESGKLVFRVIEDV